MTDAKSSRERLAAATTSLGISFTPASSPEQFVHDPHAASWWNELTRPEFLADFHEED